MVRWPALLFALILVACGGGGGDAPSGAPPSVVASSPAAPAAMLAGVAATGAPVSGRIFLKDAAGHEQFVDTTDGTYQFTLTSLSAPFMLKAQWTSAGVAFRIGRG